MNILDFIPLGITNAISQEELAICMNCDKRTVRQAVFNARAKGAVICSTCEETTGGYYIPLSVDEALPYVNMQRNRIKSATLALKSVEDFIKNSQQGGDSI